MLLHHECVVNVRLVVLSSTLTRRERLLRILELREGWFATSRATAISLADQLLLLIVLIKCCIHSVVDFLKA